MEHSFDINIASQYGIAEAIILKHLYFWCKKNELNEQNFYDGRYWTYNSIKAFAGLFPYLTERQLRYTLQKLKDNGLILISNNSDNPLNRTLWYALTDKGVALFEQKTQVAFDKNVKSDLPKLSEPFDKNVKCNNKYINNIQSTTDVKPDINTDNARAREAVMQPIPFTPPAELDRQKRLDMHTLPPDTQKAEEWFERFWAAYPKKQNKTLARLAWLRLPYNTGLYDKICETVQRWSATRRDWRTEGGRYVPMPENFLNDGRWEDEPPTQTFDGPMDIASMAAMIMAEGDGQSADRERYNQGFCDMERRRLDAAKGGGQGGISDDCPIDVEAIRTA